MYIFNFSSINSEMILDRVKISMFADDCVLYYMGNNWNTVHSALQSDFTKFVIWSDSNILKLNATKTQAMIVATRNKLSKLRDQTPFTINGTEIKYLHKYNFLSFVLDSELNLQPLCKILEKRVVDKIFMLKKLRHFLTYKAAIQIYKQTILRSLNTVEYC